MLLDELYILYQVHYIQGRATYSDTLKLDHEYLIFTFCHSCDGVLMGHATSQLWWDSYWAMRHHSCGGVLMGHATSQLWWGSYWAMRHVFV